MQLQQNEFVASLLNLVVKTKVNLTTKGTRINELVDSCVVDPEEYGDGVGIITADTLAVKDYSETSSILTPEKPTLDEQVLSTTDKKYIKVTINRWLMKGAFADEYSISRCIEVIISMLQKTKMIYLYKKIVKAFEDYVPTVDTQTVEVEILPEAGLTGQELNETRKINALSIYQKVREKSLAVQSPSRKYNDLAYEEMYNAEDMDFIINGNFDETVNTYAYASLLNSDKLNNIKLYDKSIIIPVDQFTKPQTKTDVIGWLVSKKKYQIIPRFEVMLDWLDISTLNEQEYLHFWLRSGFVNGLAAIKLVVKQPAAKTASIK